ncbi:phospholipase D-like domain-containing protein [Halocatena marina]|uniref:phospholipase D-like domain-containing protein n=1 Tax=Halocatena marina TaxID=2934937 RepID=UPI00200E5A53|nr:phospholipase D-like domain-containing protein [Halocatena marina]
MVTVERVSESESGSERGWGLKLILVASVLLLGTSSIALAVGPTNSTGVTTIASDTERAAGIEIVRVYPNPVTDDDRGEFVVIDVPRKTNVSGWELRDEESVVSLPNRTVSGRIVLSTEPKAVKNMTDEPVLQLTGKISLSNAGERVRLVRDGTSVTTVEYSDAPEGELYQRDSGEWTWEPFGATDLSVVESGPSAARLFVLPDAPKAPASTLDSATDRILLGGYTFTSDRIASALVRAHRRGVHVEVLVESGPVGGITTQEKTVLDRLTAAGIDVHVLGGERARYAYHHAKYAVVDDRALVMTENWKPSGVGGHSNRGWGAIVRDSVTADELAAVFAADTGWLDTKRWREFSRNETFEPSEPSFESYPSTVPPKTVPVEQTRLLAAPDNAEPELLAVMNNATESISVVQVSIEGFDGPFTQAALQAARRGVEVRILLSNAWYVQDENRALAERLNRLAGDSPLEVRLAEPNGRFEKIHAKGVIVDSDQVVVGSLNWNPYSARENREIAVVLMGDAVGEYFSSVFDADWRGKNEELPTPIPVGIIAALGIAILIALVLANALEFEPKW